MGKDDEQPAARQLTGDEVYEHLRQLPKHEQQWVIDRLIDKLEQEIRDVERDLEERRAEVRDFRRIWKREPK